jgi:putative ATP-binding cassette transporter
MPQLFADRYSTTRLRYFTTRLRYSTTRYSIYPQLFVAIIAYAAFGTGMSVYVGRSLVASNFQQLQREADFRFALVRLQLLRSYWYCSTKKMQVAGTKVLEKCSENAESIAFYGGEKQEMKQVKTRLSRTIDNSFRRVVTKRNLLLY